MKIKEIYQQIQIILSKPEISDKDILKIQELKQIIEKELKYYEEDEKMRTDYAEQKTLEYSQFKYEQNSLAKNLPIKTLLAFMLMILGITINFLFSIPAVLLATSNLKKLNSLAPKRECEQKESEYDIAIFNLLISHQRNNILISLYDIINYLETILPEKNINQSQSQQLQECFKYIDYQFSELNQTNEVGPSGLGPMLIYKQKNSKK